MPGAAFSHSTGGEMIAGDSKLSFFMAEHGMIQMMLPILTVVFVILASMIYQQTEK